MLEGGDIMTEGIGQPEEAALPRESACFPVTKEAVDAALGAIAENPDRMLVQEGALLQVENPELNQGLLAAAAGLRVDRGNFSEGAVFTHRILRQQAEMRGEQMPVVTDAGWHAHMQGQIDEMNAGDPHITIDARAIQKMQEIGAKDPEFGKAVDDLTKYRAGKPSFYNGVIHTYLPLKHAAEGQAMEKQFGGGQ